MSRQTPCLVLMTSILFAILAPGVHAFGISPGDVVFGPVEAGGYAETSVLVSSSLDEEWTVEVVSDGPAVAIGGIAPSVNPTEPSLNAADSGGAADADSSAVSFPIMRGSPRRLTLRLFSPEDAAPGLAGGFLTFRFVPPAQEGEGKRSLVVNALRVPYTYRVLGDSIVSCVVGGVSISPAEQGQEAIVRYRIKNTGTARVSPVFTLTVDGAARVWTADEVLPTAETEGTWVFRQGLPPGEYNATIAACGDEILVPFTVLAPGTGGSGSLERVIVGTAGAGAGVGEDAGAGDSRDAGPVPVQAVFRNTGETVVTARLRGQVLDAAGKTVALLESEPLRVLPGEQVLLEDYFTPPSVDSAVADGPFTIRAKVVYEGKVSSEQEVSYILPAPSRGRISIVLSALFIVIAVLLILIVLRRDLRRRH